MGGLKESIFGGETRSEKELRRTSTAPFESFRIQRFLPPSLRLGKTGEILRGGIEGIGDLIRRPGGLSPTVSEAILPRLALESENIAQQFRGVRAEQAGRAARTNLPVSIRNALASALDVAQERAQRGTRREALAESERLRRADVGQTFGILDAILQFLQSGRGGAIRGLGQAAQSEAQRQAGTQALIGSILTSPAITSGSRFKEGFEDVSGEDILDAISLLPVYEWSYKGEESRHIGPMAEDFLMTFGLGSDPDSIEVVDAIGTLMAATQALTHKVKRLEAEP